MSHYVIESKLSTSKQQKWVAAGISSVLAALIVLLMYWLHIRVPNPPFAKKDGELLLDFGLEEVSYGRPTDGGPSAFPPAKGGDNAPNPSASPTSAATPSGGLGDIVNTSDQTAPLDLPPIDPPESKTPSVNARLKGVTSQIGKRTGNNNGDPNGIEGGQGNTGFGGTTNNGGIFGNGGKRVTRNTGNGFYSAEGFANHTINSSVKKVDADGVGVIYAQVIVDCAGNASVKRVLPKGNYTGTAVNAKKVMNYFLSRSRFIKVGDKCPEIGTISLDIKKGLNN